MRIVAPLSGSLKIGVVTIPLSALPASVTRAIITGFQWQPVGTERTLVKKAIDLEDCGSLLINSVTVGNRYVRTAVTVLGN